MTKVMGLWRAKLHSIQSSRGCCEFDPFRLETGVKVNGMYNHVAIGKESNVSRGWN